MHIGNPPFRVPYGARQVHMENNLGSYFIPKFSFELEAIITSSSESDILTAASSTTATESACLSNPTETFLMLACAGWCASWLLGRRFLLKIRFSAYG
jgi:hypothetical protein